ncbi:ATP-binding cassette domain-containing protein [Nakamurella flava]|uniref:ATP-binding cassette domain-containing protein n=1 Tax=Nakamurella flava TaxID=2576308 RepID=A0A4U6QIQ0_9ACTN|nr:ATP-binding cassette domain-containing protein [Nakamurella flava]TKV60260.1 ATP-binding cassette domain-containing protein [Nakamurella flava]
MTAGPVTTRELSTATELTGGAGWEVVDGTVLVGLPLTDGHRPVDRPAFATLQCGDVIVAASRSPLLVRPVGSATLLPLPSARATAQDPAVARWLTTLALAAGRSGWDPAASGRAGEELPATIQTLVETVTVHHDDLARSRAHRATGRAVSPLVDGAALHELGAAVGSLQTGRAAALDVTGELLELLGLSSGPPGPGGPTAVEPAVESHPGRPGSAADPWDAVRRRAAADGHLLRTVELGRGVRTDLVAPVLTRLDGRPVAVVPRGWGADVVDPAEGTRRRLNQNLVDRLESTGLSAVPQLPRRAGLRELARLAGRGAAPDGWLVVGAAAVAAALSMLVPLAGGAIFSSIVPGQQYQRLAALVGALMAVIAATAALALLQGRVTARIRTRIDAVAGDAIWARLLRLPASFFHRHGTGDLLARASTVDTLRRVVTDAVVSSLVAGAVVVVSLVLVTLHSPTAGLFTLGGVLLQAALFWWVLRRWQPLMQAEVEHQQVLAESTLQAMRGMARIRAFAAEDRFMRLLSARFAALTRTTFRAARYEAGVATALAAWPTLGTVAVTAGVVLAGAGATTAGDYVVITTALAQVLAGTAALLGAASQLVGVRPALRQLEPILATEPEVGHAAGSTAAPVHVRGRIDLVGVDFRYRDDGPEILHDVSLTVEPGEFVAVVGPSGSGKSTLLRLVLGFERPTSGVVAFDGVPLDRMDPRAVRRRLGTVLQNSSLFPGSLADNIRGPRALSMEQVWNAAEAAGVADDIRRMPMGMQTVVVEGAATLSGGQRQRIVIARALAGAPRILLLDEATSALDNVAQAQVAASLDRLHVTRLVVAHRLSTVRHADRIVVLDGGRVVQQGGYAELLAEPGMFRDLADRQLIDGD